jgi:trimeric autotransporter adhesin
MQYMVLKRPMASRGGSFSNSTIMGHKAGRSLSTGSDNILLGFQAGDNLTTGSRNIIIGYDLDASAFHTTNELNIGDAILGDLSSGDIDITGSLTANEFHGDGSGLSNITGDNLGNHVATTTLQMGVYGVNTSSDITAASYQINGSDVLKLTGSGSGSVSVGIDAGRINTSNRSSFIGYEAGYSNSSSDYNYFFGYNAGKLNTSGNSNVFIGGWTGDANQGGSYNTFIGLHAGGANISGLSNTFIGPSAGQNNIAGSYNVFIGPSAGMNAKGSNNIFLGWQAGDNLTTGTDNIIIGHNINASAVDVTNELNIGDVIKGDLSNGTVGIGAKPANASNMLELTSTTQGFVLTRMTEAQRDAIVTPSAGMMIYQTDGAPSGLYVYDGSDWFSLDMTQRTF